VTTGHLTLHGPILTGGRELPPSRLEIRDGRIESVSQGPKPDSVDLVVSDGWIAPGLIDLQVSGAGGVERVALVSDALAAAALPAGPSILGNQMVLSDGRLVRRPDGTTAGSAVLLDEGLRNVCAWLPWLPAVQAVRLCTETPARALGPRVAARKGQIPMVTTPISSSWIANGESEPASCVERSCLPPRAVDEQSMTDDASLDSLPTEQPNPRTVDLDLMDTPGILERINDEDLRVAPAVRAAIPDLARAVDIAVERWRRGGRVILFGAGTSGRLALLDAAEIGPTYGVPSDRYMARMAGGVTAMRSPAEGSEDDYEAGEAIASDLTDFDVAMGIAASGRTRWVLGALAAARRCGSATIGLACVPVPELGSYVDVTIAVDVGPEAVAGSMRMKAGTAQKLALNAFSTALMVRLGKVYGTLMVDVQATNEKLRRRATRLVQEIAQVDRAVAERTLAEADWNAKTAIVALRLQLPPGTARARLAEADGQLRRVLGED
jgi:N-acetylmuramic acid 6-phosphate etherase